VPIVTLVEVKLACNSGADFNKRVQFAEAVVSAATAVSFRIDSDVKGMNRPARLRGEGREGVANLSNSVMCKHVICAEPCGMKARPLLSLLQIDLREGSSVSARSKAFFIELYRSPSSTFGFAAFKI
jgi:hypothetical protein